MNDDRGMCNPFSTRFTRPGKLDYRFPPDTNAAQLCHALRQQQWWGAILGDHGTGKTTLLHALIPHLEYQGREVRWFALHAGDRRLSGLRQLALGPDAQIIIDGYEQLRWWTRLAIQRQCRQQRAGLLVTTHRPVRIPVLYRTQSSLEIAHQLVHELTSKSEINIDSLTVASCYERHRGNMRETLFDLYDCYERQIRD